MLLSLINLGSGVALQALIAIPGITLNVSYFIPILLLLIRKLKGEHPRYGPFKLGSYGIPVNLVALCFTGYCTFWVSFPIAYPVVAETMNYAAPILIGLISLALLDWFTTGKRRFVIPMGQYNIEMEEEYNDRKHASSEEAPSE